jgi:hypothetical protein
MCKYIKMGEDKYKIDLFGVKIILVLEGEDLIFRPKVDPSSKLLN